MHDDPWIRENSYLSPEKTHALGFLSIIWTSCEFATHEMFKFVAGLSTPIGRIISHDLGDITIWTKIVQIAEERRLDQDFVSHLKHASRFHEICRINRNQYVHISLKMGELFTGDSAFRLARDKGAKRDVQIINDSVEEIRRVCNDAKTLKGYCNVLMFTLGFRNDPPDGENPRAWPDKPTLPEFVWKPPLQKRPKQPRPLTASRAKPLPADPD